MEGQHHKGGYIVATTNCKEHSIVIPATATQARQLSPLKAEPALAQCYKCKAMVSLAHCFLAGAVAEAGLGCSTQGMAMAIRLLHKLD